MGAEMIKLNTANLKRQDLARLQFTHHEVAAPNLSIWMMNMAAAEPVFPWWSYGASLDEDINKLSMLSGITSAQSLFDFLFMLQLRKAFPTGLYVLVPGNVRTDGWSQLSERAQTAIQRGQNCVYRLDASFGKKISINWVPFYQPQCLVKDPSGDLMTRFFNAAKSEDATTSLSFFSLTDLRRMPEIVRLLIEKEDARSEKIGQLVDMFGVYSSPRDDRHGTCALAYASNPASLAPLKAFERGFAGAVDQVRGMLVADPTPGAVLKIISRLVAL